MIIDAHLHVWDRSRARYDWLGPHLPEVDRDVAFDEIGPVLARLGVRGAVLVQSADNAEDTRNMLREAASAPIVLGVVGWVPLEAPDRAREQFAALAAEPRIVGIRNLIHDRPDPDWVLAPAFGEGLAQLAQHGMPFDFVTANPAALSRLDRIAADHPTVTFVLDHLAKPPINGDADAHAAWERALRAVAARPNVVAKVSGLYSAVGAEDSWTQGALDRVVDVAADAFGAERLMYGGDWPMSLRAGGYERVLDGIRSATRGWSAAASEQLWWRTAARTYGLDVLASGDDEG
ncbi:amidohydrolase family protein [Microbacterium sp. NPDC090007]|uniref:amidohydrolase family protein n=1 Tax=Microbacterium sp. NPDC090007 TaxID=3364204 RepID=UPI003803363C